MLEPYVPILVLIGFVVANAVLMLGLSHALSNYRRTPTKTAPYESGVPVLGDVVRKGAVARFTRTLGTLISSGVPILTGLEITARTAGNRVIQEAIMAARASIREGETISAPLRQSNVFPPMVVQMISVGEETGALDDMLTRIADFYDSEVDTAVESLTSLIEPIMIVFMGTVVGGMVVAMYLPMFKLINVVAGGH